MIRSNVKKWKGNADRVLLQRKNILISKLKSSDIIKATNTWAVILVWHSGKFVDWTRVKLKDINTETRKLTTTNGALHPGADTSRLHVHISNSLTIYKQNTKEARAAYITPKKACEIFLDLKIRMIFCQIFGFYSLVSWIFRIFSPLPILLDSPY